MIFWRLLRLAFAQNGELNVQSEYQSIQVAVDCCFHGNVWSMAEQAILKNCVGGQHGKVV